MGGGSNSGKVGASEALSLVFRIATVGLSLASAITTAASTQSQCVHEDCNGEATATVSFGNYNSFKYSALADLLSAVLQGVAICLEVARKDKAAKVVELIDSSCWRSPRRQRRCCCRRRHHLLRVTSRWRAPAQQTLLHPGRQVLREDPSVVGLVPRRRRFRLRHRLHQAHPRKFYAYATDFDLSRGNTKEWRHNSTATKC
nr:uncharacterized protein LOC123494418 [Aegilops tauschii subsp. strangulata]